MRARFDGAPIIAGGDDDRVHAVHDAFVMGRGAIRICGGESIRGDDAITDTVSAIAFESQFLRWDERIARGQCGDLQDWKEYADGLFRR